MNYAKRVFGYVRPYSKLAAFSAILMFSAAGAGLLTPWPLQILIDNVVSNHPLPHLLQIVLGPFIHSRVGWLVFAVCAGLGVTLVQNTLNVLNNYVNTKLNQLIALDYRGEMFQHAQHLSLSYHDHRQTGQLLYAINNQGDGVARAVMVVPPIVQSVLTLAGMLWISLRIDWQLALLSLTVIPFLYYSVAHYM